MKLIMENWNKFVNEEEQVEEGIMDFFRSKDPADVALKEVEQYLETTSQNAFKTARAVLSQNIKKKTSSANFITQNFDRKDIRKMQNMLQPLQIKFSTGDQSGQDVPVTSEYDSLLSVGPDPEDFVQLDRHENPDPADCEIHKYHLPASPKL